MAKYKCIPCGYVYDEEEEETRWEKLPKDWVCPLCGAGKKEFKIIEDEE